MKITPALEANDVILRELHHRFRNNFQVIASLISLQARSLPPERRGELRFVEEQVQAMAAAYRNVGVVHGIVEVGLAELITDVLSSLHHLAGLSGEMIELALPAEPRVLRIDQAIALGLYLAVLIPPYFEATAGCAGMVRMAVHLPGEEWIRITLLTPAGAAAARPSLLRQRLGRTYLSQMAAAIEPPEIPGELRVRIHAPPFRPAETQ